MTTSARESQNSAGMTSSAGITTWRGNGDVAECHPTDPLHGIHTDPLDSRLRGNDVATRFHRLLQRFPAGVGGGQILVQFR